MKLLFVFFVSLSLSSIAQFGEETKVTFPDIDPSFVSSIDLDGDGDVDHVFASNRYCEYGGHVIVWYENLGGYFDTVKVISIVPPVRSLIAGDFDLDGDVDLLGSDLNEVYWLENYGGTVYSAKQTIANINVSDLSLSDADGDGDLDVFFASSTSLGCIRNLGSGVFSSSSIVSGGGVKRAYSLSDLDNDGDVDIVYISDNSVDWHKNLGSGSFGAIQNLANNIDGGRDVLINDLDSDGDLDIICAAYVDNEIILFDNLGSGIFDSKQVLIGLNDAWQVESSDMDGDGDMDLIAKGLGLFWIENLGGVFPSAQLLSPDYEFVEEFNLEDVNSDGFIDVLYWTGSDNRISWYSNDGLANFTREEISEPSGNLSLQYIDVDGDGNKDILSGYGHESKITWNRNLGAGHFGSHAVIPNTIPYGNGLKDVFGSDMDGDGDVDIVYADIYSKKVLWIENIGSGNFGSEHLISNLVDSPYSISVSDLDGDGDLDVVVGSSGSDEVVWFENDGFGSFGAEIVISSTVDGASYVLSIDFDQDGDIDIASVSNQKVAWYENNGSGVFGPRQVIVLQQNAEKILFSDFDNDGLLDVLITAYGFGVGWVKNLGNGNFGAIQSIFSGSGFSGIASGDIYHTGGSDIVIMNSGVANVYRYLGGTFILSGVVSPVCNNEFLELIDIDLDGDLDMLAGGSVISVYLSYVVSSTLVKGELFVDINQNGQLDSIDIFINQLGVYASPASDYTFTDQYGKYSMNFSDTLSTYHIFPEKPLGWSVVTDSLSYSIVVDTIVTVRDSLNFGFYPDSIFNKVSPELTGGGALCNQVANMWINYENEGTTICSGLIELTLDDSLVFVNSIVPPDSIIGQKVYWHYDSLLFFQNDVITLEVLLPTFASLGTTLSSELSISVYDSAFNVVSTFTDTLLQLNVCAYDPNDKQVLPLGIDSPGYILPDTEELEFLIRFQNTGNATATDVVISDYLDPSLNWQSLDVLASSHNVNIKVEQYGEVKFSFENIMLPDSGANYFGSQGFVKYKIDLNPNLPLNTSIHNYASIFFDQNPPVITNSTINTLYECLDEIDFILQADSSCAHDVIIGSVQDDLSITEFLWEITGVNSSTSDSISWSLDTSGLYSLSIETDNFLCSRDTILAINVSPNPIVNLDLQAIDTLCEYSGNEDVSGFGTPAGGQYSGVGIVGSDFSPSMAGEGTHLIYYVYIDSMGCTSNDSSSIYVSVCLGIDNNNVNLLSIYPNPFSDIVTISFEKKNPGLHSLIIYDVQGREVFASENFSNKLIVSKGQMSSGLFIFEITDEFGASICRERVVVE